MDRIVDFYPVPNVNNWEWRLPYAAQKYSIDNSSNEKIKTILEKCMYELKQFEEDIKEKLGFKSSKILSFQ